MQPLARVFALTLTASLGLLLYACESGGDGGTSSGTFDAGNGNYEASAGGGEGGSETDGGGSDGGAVVKQPLTTCSPLVDIDSLGEVQPASLAAASFNGKYLFAWSQRGSVSPDGKDHLKGRYFDGNAFTAEVDFGPGLGQLVSSSVDGSGRAFLMWQADGATLGLGVFDLTTGTIVSSVTIPIGGGVSYGVGGLVPEGALAISQTQDRTEVVIDRYGAAAGWSSDAGTDAGTFPTPTGAIESAFVALNAAGKGVVGWTLVPTSGTTNLYVTPFDGTSLGTTVLRVYTGDEPVLFTGAALSNGDAVIAWRTTGSALATFHSGAPAGSEWEPDMVLTTTLMSGGPLVLVGPGDDITALYTEAANGNVGSTKATRRLAGTWSAPFIVAASSDVARAAIDPGGNIIVAGQSGGISVTRLPATSTSTPPVVATGFQQSNIAAVTFAFDKNGDPVLGGWDIPSTTSLHFGVTTCTTAP